MSTANGSIDNVEVAAWTASVMDTLSTHRTEQVQRRAEAENVVEAWRRQFGRKFDGRGTITSRAHDPAFQRAVELWFRRLSDRIAAFLNVSVVLRLCQPEFDAALETCFNRLHADFVRFFFFFFVFI